MRVEVPDAFAGSELTWRLHERADVVEEDGRWVVRVEAGGDVTRVLSAIRDWVIIERLEAVVVHVNGERHVLVP